MACKDRAAVPGSVDVLGLEARERGTCPSPTLTFRVIDCFHCAQPPCVGACAVGSISSQGDSLVQVDAQPMYVCGQCVEACPFAAVTLGPDDIAVECDGCADEVTRGWKLTCVRTCSLRAPDYRLEEDALPSVRQADESFDALGKES